MSVDVNRQLVYYKNLKYKDTLQTIWEEGDAFYNNSYKFDDTTGDDTSPDYGCSQWIKRIFSAYGLTLQYTKNITTNLVITIGHSTAHYISFSRDASMVFSLLAEDRCKSLKFQSNNGNAKTILNKTNNEFLIAASGTGSAITLYFDDVGFAMDAFDCYLWDATSNNKGKTLGDLIEKDKYHIKDTLFITDKIRSTENPDTKIEITNNDYMSNHGNIIKNDIIKQYTRLVTIPNYELGGSANYKILSFDGNIKNNNIEDSQYGFSSGIKYNGLKDKVNAKYFTAKPQVYPEIIYDTMSGGFDENECLQDTMGVDVQVQSDCVILQRSGYAAVNIDFDSNRDIILIYRRRSGNIKQLSSIPVSVKDPIKTTYGGWVESTHKSKGLWGYLASDWYATPYLPKLNINYELTFNPIECCVIKPKTGYTVYLNPTYHSDWWDNDSRGVLSKVELDNNLTLKSIIKTTTQNIEYTINESRELKWLSNEKFIVQHPIIFNWKATVPYINNNSNYTKIIDITLNSLWMTKGDITNNFVSIVPRFKSTFGSLPTGASFFKNSSGEIKTNLLDYYIVGGVTQESRISSIEWNHISGTYHYKKTTGVGNHDVDFSLSMNFENNDTTDSVAHSIVIWRNGLSALNE